MPVRCSCLEAEKLEGVCYFHAKQAAGLLRPDVTGPYVWVGDRTAYEGELSERQLPFVGVDLVSPESQGRRGWLDTWELANLPPQDWEPRLDEESWSPGWGTVTPRKAFG